MSLQRRIDASAPYSHRRGAWPDFSDVSFEAGSQQGILPESPRRCLKPSYGPALTAIQFLAKMIHDLQGIIEGKLVFFGGRQAWFLIINANTRLLGQKHVSL